MEQLLICMSLSLIAGLLASRAAKAVRLPAVTSYLVAGLLLGPFFLGRLGLSGWGFGFGSLAQVESYGIITQVALGFIAFVIGNEFRLSVLESGIVHALRCDNGRRRVIKGQPTGAKPLNIRRQIVRRQRTAGHHGDLICPAGYFRQVKYSLI